MNIIKKSYNWIMDTKVDLRVRLLYVLLVAVLLANAVAVVTMIAMGQSFVIWCSNIAMFVLMLIAAFCVFIKKRNNLGAIFLSLSCDIIGIPVMFFTSGGNDSGMPIWMVFAVIVTALICIGREREIIVSVTIVIDIVCIVIAHMYPGFVVPLTGENAVYNDMIFSFITVAILSTILILIHLKAYDNQRKVLEEQQKEIARIAMLDELTGVYNRRAYESDIRKIIGESHNKENSEGLAKAGALANVNCLVIADVNGLKRANDELGHVAGDEIIAATAKCLESAFEGCGKVYRIGGDEFAAILNYENGRREQLFKKLDELVSSWSGEYSKNLAIAKGFCVIDEHPELDSDGLEKVADVMMYEDKRRFYETSGVDRRRR